MGLIHERDARRGEEGDDHREVCFAMSTMMI